MPAQNMLNSLISFPCIITMAVGFGWLSQYLTSFKKKKKKIHVLQPNIKIFHIFFNINTTFKSLFKKKLYFYVFKCESDDMGLTNKIISNR